MTSLRRSVKSILANQALETVKKITNKTDEQLNITDHGAKYQQTKQRFHPLPYNRHVELKLHLLNITAIVNRRFVQFSRTENIFKQDSLESLGSI